MRLRSNNLGIVYKDELFRTEKGGEYEDKLPCFISGCNAFVRHSLPYDGKFKLNFIPHSHNTIKPSPEFKFVKITKAQLNNCADNTRSAAGHFVKTPRNYMKRGKINHKKGCYDQWFHLQLPKGADQRICRLYM